MSEETMNQNTEQKPTNSNPEDKNGDPGSGRTFTQAAAVAVAAAVFFADMCTENLKDII